MSTFQKVTILGNVGKDPEIRYMPSGKAVANFSLATSERWKDKDSGEQVEKTEWHRCTAYDKLAEIIGEYVKKGSKILVEGKLSTRKWDDQAGVTRYSTEINVTEMKMVTTPREGEGGEAPRQQATPTHDSQGRALPPRAAPAPRQAPAQASSEFDDMSDDIPY